MTNSDTANSTVGRTSRPQQRRVRMPLRKYKIGEQRILQICNDIAEDMGHYTKKELVEVVKYQCDVVMDECQKKSELHSLVITQTLENTNKILEVLKAS